MREKINYKCRLNKQSLLLFIAKGIVAATTGKVLCESAAADARVILAAANRGQLAIQIYKSTAALP